MSTAGGWDPSRNPPRQDEDCVLIAQLQLLLRNVHSAFLPTVFLSIVLVWALSNDSNSVEMKIWVSVLMLSKLVNSFHAHLRLTSDIPRDRARGLAQELIVLNVIDGTIWGALPWITLDSSSMAGSILVIATMAAIVGSTMSRLSPVLAVFTAFAAPMLLLVTTKVWILGDPAYDALGAASVIYFFSLSLMARNTSHDIRAGIDLRFENIALIDQLQEKTRIAETAQREAERANAAKSKFLAAASHDLRQPIHAQGLFLETLARTELAPPQQELLHSARAASQASSELLNELLDFSRVEAGVITPNLQPFRLQPLFNKIENELAPQADAKNIVFRSRETAVAVESDPILVELILRNLVSNAIRYTHRGGILVACRQRYSRAVLEVWDTGIGIPPEHQQEIFREFYQLGNPERDHTKGLGLGLAIAEGLARALGHRLSLSSIPQRGSVFRLELPSTILAPTGKYPAMQSKARFLAERVLVIDDDEIVRAGMLHLLRDWGCECKAVESIEEALASAKASPPQLVISDYRLRQQRNGVDAIFALRELLGDTLPAVLITGDTAPERLREAMTSGIPLLHKPVSPSQLYRKLVEILDKPVDTLKP